MGLNNGTPKAALPLMSFRPPETVQRALNKDKATRVLPIEKAYGPMNIDNSHVRRSPRLCRSTFRLRSSIA